MMMVIILMFFTLHRPLDVSKEKLACPLGPSQLCVLYIYSTAGFSQGSILYKDVFSPPNQEFLLPQSDGCYIIITNGCLFRPLTGLPANVSSPLKRSQDFLKKSIVLCIWLNKSFFWNVATWSHSFPSNCGCVLTRPAFLRWLWFLHSSPSSHFMGISIKYHTGLYHGIAALITEIMHEKHLLPTWTWIYFWICFSPKHDVMLEIPREPAFGGHLDTDYWRIKANPGVCQL